MKTWHLKTTSGRFIPCCFVLFVLANNLIVGADDRQNALHADGESWKQIVAVENVCAWPNLTLLPDGTIAAFIFNEPTHGQGEGDIDCWASVDGVEWERRSTVTQHKPNTIRMNCAAGLTKNGDLVVLCSGWTNEKQAERPKQQPFRDAVLRSWVLRSSDGGRTWKKREEFPKPEPGWTEHIPFGDIWIGNDGALHTSCYQGHYKDPATTFKTDRWRSWHFRSDDDGHNWKAVSIIGPSHNETDIFPLGGKSWLAAARITSMELLRSDDNGETWSEPKSVTEQNEINGHLTRLHNGKLLLSYGVRVRGQRGVCAKLSSDDGSTWGEPIRLAHTVGDADCGYPSSVQQADGRIVTAWYSKKTPEYDGYHMGVTIWSDPAKSDPDRKNQLTENNIHAYSRNSTSRETGHERARGWRDGDRSCLAAAG